MGKPKNNDKPKGVGKVTVLFQEDPGWLHDTAIDAGLPIITIEIKGRHISDLVKEAAKQQLRYLPDGYRMFLNDRRVWRKKTELTDGDRIIIYIDYVWRHLKPEFRD